MITNNVELNAHANFSLSHSIACALIICTLLSFIVHNIRSNWYLKLLLNFQGRLPCSMLWEEHNSATAFIFWWLKCRSRNWTEGLCVMLVSPYPSLLPKYFITASVAPALLRGQVEVMPHCVGQIQHPHSGYLSDCRVPEKHEGHLTVQTTCHQSISVCTCFFKLSRMRVFLSTDALSHNLFIFELLVAWGEPVLPWEAVTLEWLLLMGCVVPSPSVLGFSGGCLSHVMLATRMCP